MTLFHDDVLGPVLVFAIPIVAIAGGILAGIVRTVSSHRLMEVAIRERMALVARGVDPDRIPGTVTFGPAGTVAVTAVEKFRAQGLLVAGFVTMVAGWSMILVDRWVVFDGAGTWPLGVMGVAIGFALLLSGAVIWPRGRRAGTS
jgi:hypothetical protein